MMLMISLLSNHALAYEVLQYCGDDWADGSQLTYHININDFTTSGVDEIEKGANAWDAGSGERVRGADWNFIRGSDITSDGTNGNYTNEVYKKPDTFFAGFGRSGAEGMTLRTYLGCGRRDTDVVFNEAYTYTTAMPSESTSGNPPIGYVAMHEFGHVLGLDENDLTQSASLAVMNSAGHSDIAGLYRINEDDYLGLVDGKSDSSTGRNLMLQKYWRVDSAQSTATEVWTSTNLIYEGDWEGCPAQTIDDSAGPGEILAVIVGTSSQSPLIQWKLSSDTTCFSGTEYSLGTRTPTISSNEPYPVVPDDHWYIPSGTPLGNYYLCAMIDPGDFISETSEADNIIRSEELFEVHSCP